MAWEAADAKLAHFQTVVQEMEQELEEYEDHIKYLHRSYKARMNDLVEDTGAIYMIEHYLESPSYNTPYAKNMVDTLTWLSYSDEEKKRLLDDEMDMLVPPV